MELSLPDEEPLMEVQSNYVDEENIERPNTIKELNDLNIDDTRPIPNVEEIDLIGLGPTVRMNDKKRFMALDEDWTDSDQFFSTLHRVGTEHDVKVDNVFRVLVKYMCTIGALGLLAHMITTKFMSKCDSKCTKVLANANGFSLTVFWFMWFLLPGWAGGKYGYYNPKRIKVKRQVLKEEIQKWRDERNKRWERRKTGEPNPEIVDGLKDCKNEKEREMFLHYGQRMEEGIGLVDDYYEALVDQKMGIKTKDTMLKIWLKIDWIVGVIIVGLFIYIVVTSVLNSK